MIRRQEFLAHCDWQDCTAQAVEAVFFRDIRLGQYCGLHVDQAIADAGETPEFPESTA